jgi:Rhodanese-like domain
MQKKMLKKFIPLAMCASFLVTGVQLTGCVTATPEAQNVKAPVPAKKNVLKGKVAGKSNKARLITINSGKPPKAVNLKFDDNTEGLEKAKPGEIVIVKFRVEDGEKIATLIEPNLLSAPPGTTAVDTPYVAGLINSKSNHILIDSRPPARFNWGAIPTAVSIPYSTMKTKEAALKVLPKDKGTELVFYCQGFT